MEREDICVLQRSSHLKVSQCLHCVFMGAAFTERVTDGISNCRSDKYYFPLLKVAHFVSFSVYSTGRSVR